MTTTAIQPWECHVPKSVSLYFVDYNESLDEHEDLQEKCIRQNSMLPLDEESSEWYSEQFSENPRCWTSKSLWKKPDLAASMPKMKTISVTCSMSGMTPIRLKADKKHFHDHHVLFVRIGDRRIPVRQVPSQ